MKALAKQLLTAPSPNVKKESTNMAAEPEHIVRARQLLAGVKETTRAYDRPLGVVTVADILDAEQRLAEAQLEVRSFATGQDGLREAIDKTGTKELVVERHRMDTLEHLQAKVNARRLELHSVKQAWAAGLTEKS